jgi:hypothetical protein
MHMKRCGRPGTARSPTSSAMVLEQFLPAIHQLYGNEHFTFNRIVHHHTITETSEGTLMEPNQVNGQDRRTSVEYSHVNLSPPPP